MKSAHISIIILQYNNSQDTIRCLNSVKELDYPDYKVTIIDNASEVKEFNSTRLFIESLGNPKFTILSAGLNLGYSGGNNLGIKKALDGGADYILILNPDTTVDRGALSQLIKASESNRNAGIIGPAINEGGHTVYGGKINWLKPELAHKHAHTTDTNPLILNTSYYIPGAAMLIKREVIEKIGMLDERYFLYFEDADYCIQAGKAGFKLVIMPKSKVTHTGSASTNSLGSALLLRYHYRNTHIFNWKNGPPWVKFTLPFWSLLVIIKQLIKIIFMPRKKEISKAILAGVTDFYGRRFGKIND